MVASASSYLTSVDGGVVSGMASYDGKIMVLQYINYGVYGGLVLDERGQGTMHLLHDFLHDDSRVFLRYVDAHVLGDLLKVTLPDEHRLALFF